MRSDILVSVVIPLYRGKKYVDDLVDMIMESANEASIENNLEIILVNDYPEEKIENDKHVVNVYNNEKNMGIHYSRAKGINASNGKYIHMLDQDDIIGKHFYKSQLNKIKQSDCVVSNGIIEHSDYSRYIYRSKFAMWLVKKPLAYVYMGNRRTSPGQCLIKKVCIPDEWLNNCMKTNGSDDFLLWMLMFDNNCSLSVNYDVLYKHTYTGENTSLDNDKLFDSDYEMVSIYRQVGSGSKYSKKMHSLWEYNTKKTVRGDTLIFAIIDFMRKISINIRG